MIQRWRFVDPTPGEGDTETDYTFEQNPNQMTSPHQDRLLTASSTTSGNTLIVVEAARKAKEWTFSGTIRTVEFYDHLKAWSRKQHRVYLYDHLARQFTVSPISFDPVPQRNGEGNDWLMKYSFKVLVLLEWE